MRRFASNASTNGPSGDLGAGHAIPRLARWALTNLDGHGDLQRGSVEDPARSPGHALEQFERELWLLAKQAAEAVSFDPNRRELVVATTVAARRSPSRRASSPKKSPGPSSASRRAVTILPFTTFALPSTIT